LLALLRALTVAAFSIPLVLVRESISDKRATNFCSDSFSLASSSALEAMIPSKIS
jgi:hypothetical protein